MDKILENKILKSKVVSFDMFDTLVLRVIDNPEILFEMMGKIFNIYDFKKIRTSMQMKCGMMLHEKYNYPHANIDEIYDYIKDNTDIKNTNKLMKYEIDKEIDILYRNNKMYEVYQFARKNKKRIIVTSDMYLKMDTIIKILTKCGYKNIDKIYLSSEERKAKFDGTLYDYVIEQEKVLPSEILHIGDSLKDDVNMANSKGLNIYHYSETIVNKSDDISLSIANGIVRLINQNEEDFWVRTGAIGGLMYLGLYKELLNKKNKDIYFLARDGYNLFNLFKKYDKSKNVHYCYTSRRALLLASISTIDGDAMHNLPPFTFGQTIKEVLEYICMDDLFTIDDLKEVGFNSFDDRFTTVEEINRFKQIYKIREKDVLKVCKEERDNAYNYFKSLGIIDNDNLFFDCGWNGSSQYLLENFIFSLKPSTNFDFYYNGIFENEKSKRQLLNRFHNAYLFDIGENQDIVASVKDSVVILELFFGAPENSVFKYDKKSYVLDNFENNLEYKKQIYKGLDLFFSYALPLFDEYDYAIKPHNAIAPILRLIENPTEEEAITIGDIENVDAFAKQKGEHKYIAKVNIEQINNNKNIEIYWKYGLLKRPDIDNSVKKFVIKKYKVKLEKDSALKCRITGINNPCVNIFGHCSRDTKLIIKADDKVVDYKVDYNSQENLYIANANIDPSVKKVKVYYANNKLIKELNNNKINRILYKFLGILFRIFSYIKKILRFGKRCCSKVLELIKKAWVQYHFLVPPKVIKRGIINILKSKNYLYKRSPVLYSYNKKEYNYWLKLNKEEEEYQELEYKPLISFVMPVYNVKRDFLVECLDSILNQSYKNIEICIADDCSKNKETIATLKEYEEKYDNIKIVYRKENGHISKASNSALELVTGEYVAMMDNDDVIPCNAVYELVKVLNEDKTIDMIYSDEDKIDTKGDRCDPHFKSDYAPDTLLSINYFCHFTLLRTSILRKIGGWTVGLEGAQDWDLFLRFVEKAKNIYHLPKILYHWRMLEGSTSMGVKNKNYAMDTARISIENALKRRKTPGKVHDHEKVPYYWVEYLYDKEPMISIIIPTKDYASTLEQCLKSIYKKTTYKNFEIIVVDNRSSEKETFKLFDYYKKNYDNFRVIKADMEFNYSKINNLAVKEAKGDYVLLLNNDTELITENWLQIMVGYAMQKHIGAVGVKLLYPDRTIQHGGVVLGMGGVAGHVFVNEARNSIGTYSRLCVPYNYTCVTAACLMVEKKKFLEVGGLDEELKVAYNDVDFCLKLVDKGYYNIMLPMIELFHFESKSRGLEDTPEKKERFNKEAAYMYEKWENYINNDPMYNPNLSRMCAFMLGNKNVEVKQNEEK